MSSAAAPVFSHELSAYLRIWADCLAEVLGQVTGAPVACEPLASPPEGGADASDLWLRATYSGARSGELMIRLPAAGVANLARVFMGEGGAEEQREAVLELLRQVAGLVATRARDARGEAALRLEIGEAPPTAAPSTAWLRASLAEPVALEFRLDQALLDALVPPATPAAPPAEALPGQAEPGAGDKLERLMAVELTVSLRFGGRRMLLKDILELCAGAVVELDRQVHDPVDLLLDGKPVARGEVVVVDGNYGLRVTEVLSPPGAP